ncbi:MAG: family 10 glycosylhydrolase [Clostridia bacterium]|nr:family 10 glycosylhydrolase [Clostridia bacterium]
MHLKRLLPALLAVILLAASLPIAVSAEVVTVKINGFNCFRNSGNLIVYTEEYGATTATNEWGVEALVDANNQVTYVGGNNSTIPAGGFVVSGHESEVDGRMRTWIQQNIQVGDYVYYNDRTMLLTVSDEPIDMNAEVFYEVERKYDGINATRNTNNIIIYTPKKGATTGTNEYGYEITVENGLVVSLGGNNSPIPKEGFVVSGHGTGIDWLKSNVLLGMAAEYDTATKTMKFSYNAESLEKGMTAILDGLTPALEEAKENFLYLQYDVIEASIAEVKKLLADALQAHKDGGTDGELSSTCDIITNKAALIRSSISESYTVQYRAAWVRPSQKSAKEVDAYVKELHDAGINTICVEGNFNNGVIMNTPADCLFQRIKTFNYDVLQAYVDACHKYGMECHLWMAIMEVGHSKGSYYSDCIAYKKPEWLSLSQNGTPHNPDDFMMIDPANDEARKYLVDFYEYIIRNYDIDCFELDYIRYYSRADLDFGYTQAAFDKFEEQYHYGVTPTYDTNAAYWEDWKKFRMSQVTEMVKAVREMVDRVRPEVLISADVVATVNGATEYNYQDYVTWMENDWIDILHPMAYGDGFGDDIRQQVELGGDQCMIVTGLGVFMAELGATEMVRQAVEDNQLGAYGDCYFEGSAYLKDKAGPALLETVYRNEAIPPFLDPDASIKAALDYMQGRIDNVLLPLEGITAEEGEQITALIGSLKESVAEGKMDGETLKALHMALKAIPGKKAKAALERDLYRAEQITCVLYRVDQSKLYGELELPEGEPFDPNPAPGPGETGKDEEDEESSRPSEESSQEESTTESTLIDPVDDGGSSTTIIIVICAVVILGGIAAIVLILRKK